MAKKASNQDVQGTSTEEEAPTATDLLTSQHEDVRKLFKEFEKSGEGAHTTRKRIIDEVSRNLEVHAELEERIFYPACRELKNEKAQKMVGESLEEHLIVKRLIKELKPLSGSDETFESKATVLKESVEHHADEEEEDLFPPAEKEMKDERLRALGAEMLRLKKKIEGGAASQPPRGAKRNSAQAS